MTTDTSPRTGKPLRQRASTEVRGVEDIRAQHSNDAVAMAVDIQKARPVRATIEVLFEEGSRKVTPGDLERATEAAAAAFQTSLESRAPRYRIGSLKATVEYAYVQVRRTVRG